MKFQELHFFKIIPSVALSLTLVCHAFSQNARLWSEVQVSEDGNIAELFWEGIDGQTVTKIEYRVAPSTDLMESSWSEVTTAEGVNSIVLRGLSSDKTYEWRLNGMNLLSDVFRTYGVATSQRFTATRYTIAAVGQKNPPISKVYDETLQFRYVDEYLTSENIRIEVFNKEQFVIARLVLPKEATGNYSIDISQINISWTEDDVYTMVLNDGLNTEKRLRFELSAPLGDPLNVDIVVDPVFLECDAGSTSLIEYYANFSGGDPTYEVLWTIVDSGTQSPLLPPKQEVVLNASSLPKFSIDYPLPYMLTLSVRDNCGNFGEHSVRITCTVDEDDESSLLFEYVKFDQQSNTN